MMEAQPSPWQKIFYYTLTIIAIYMLVRAGVLNLYDLHGLNWNQYDLWMTFPRLLAFGACVAVIKSYGGLRSWGWHTTYSRRGLLLLVLSIVGFIAYYAACARVYSYSASGLLVGWITTIPVVLFEETCFRGLLYFSLRRKKYGVIISSILSSIIYVFFHWQAQPINEWPIIFAFGVIACGALELGTGLFWIVMAHEVIDGLWFHFGSNQTIQYPTYAIISFSCYVIGVFLTLYWFNCTNLETNENKKNNCKQSPDLDPDKPK